MVAIDDIGLGPLQSVRRGRASAEQAGQAGQAGQTRQTRQTGRDDRVVSASWLAWGVTATVSVTSASALPAARRMVARQIAAIETAANRFRENAEIHKLYRAGGRAITISPLLAELISAALITAERTAGDVDPTVSAALNAWLAPGGTPVLPVCSTRTSGVRPVPGWEQVRLFGRRLQVPAGITLDLTATAKAMACDRAAAQVADRLGVGVLVELGGDAASAGTGPETGWTVAVQCRDGALQTLLTIPSGAALVTSHLAPRVQSDVENLRRGGVPGLHLIDPHTGRPPEPVWQQASALGFSCLEATAYTIAALVRGTSARAWLTQLGVPARLVTLAGDVLTVGSWASHQLDHTQPSPSDRFVPGPRLANPRRTFLR